MKCVCFAIASLFVLAGTFAAQAEIICTPRGCWETGLKIYRNGGSGSGLGYTNHRDMTVNSKGYPQPGKRVRILRESW